MRTYNDLVELGDRDQDRMHFIQAVISEHKGSEPYRTATVADKYYRHQNPTIMQAQKIVYDLLGRATNDQWSANQKIPCRYYFYFVTQEVQYLLGNGATFDDATIKDKLGKDFDNKLQKLATYALNAGVSFGFWNNDHVEVFSALEFAPLYDEDNGALRAGVRFWQVAANKPLRATLYEEDGYTEYIKREDEDMMILQPKRSYLQIVKKSDVSGVEIYDGGNYPNFPIIPMFNINKQSELVGAREVLDAYDLMASALVNNVDDANIIYWVIKNAGGMDDIDDLKFIQRLKTLHVAHTEGEEQVDEHQINVQFQASEAALEMLRGQLFDDFMALDVKKIASGAVTATEIKAAYEPINSKVDLLEYQVTEFVHRLLDLIGLEGSPTYTRSTINNQGETIQNVLMSAQYLSKDYVTSKILEALGDVDKLDDVINQRNADEVANMQMALAIEQSGDEINAAV